MIAPYSATPTMSHPGGDVERTQPEQPEGDGWLLGAPLHGDERDRQCDRDDAEPDDDARSPGVLDAAPRGEQHEGRDRAGQQDRAGPVDAHPAGQVGRGQRGAGDNEGQDAERQVDVEDPAPRQMVGEEAAEQRSGHAGRPEDGTEVTLVAAPLARAHDVGDERLRQHDEAAGPHALHRPEGDEHAHRAGDARQRASYQEDDDGRLEEALAAVEIAELAASR